MSWSCRPPVGDAPNRKATPDNSAAEATALVPDYRPALESNANDYIAFLKNWFQGVAPEIDSTDIVRYALSAGDKTADLAAEKLISGNEAFCAQSGGKIVRDPAALTCVAQDGRAIARLAVQVFHSSPEQQGTLQFTGESAAWMSRLNEVQLADYRHVIDTLSGNGIGGGVLLSSGESFDVIRFGRLSGPDFYALKTPNHGLIWLDDVVSVKWSSDTISIMLRNGEQIEDTAKGLAPGSTIVRLRPTTNDQLKADSLSFDQPFRFVYVDPKRKQPRQVRVRADALIVQITVSRQPSQIPRRHHPDPLQQEGGGRVPQSAGGRSTQDCGQYRQENRNFESRRSPSCGPTSIKSGASALVRERSPRTACTSETSRTANTCMRRVPSGGGSGQGERRRADSGQDASAVSR